MDGRKRQRCVYVTARQKKKLIELITKHPELIACKVRQGFNYKDSQKLWQNIANECNSIPGARKTWRQWRKTWQDLRSKTKKKQSEINGELPSLAIMLTPAEQETLGIKNMSSDYQNTENNTEFIPLEQDNMEDDNSNNEDNESIASISEPESPPDVKVFTRSAERKLKLESGSNKHSSKHSDNCYFNCELLSVQEQRKIDIKQDYLNFKKDYLRQKLKLMKQQTEALKSIAFELSK